MPSFSQRVVLITGAASGIGRQLALNLAGEGACIAALDCNADALAALASELKGNKVAWAVGDVTDRSSLHAAVSQLRERLGPIDVLIASAGIGRETSALAFSAEDIEEIIRVNLIGVSNSIDAVLPEMLKRRSGHLVGLSSLASFRGLPMMAAYCASKAGLNALLDALRVELRPRGIFVTTVCPGWIRTPMTAALAIPANELLDVNRAARIIFQAIHRRQPFVAFPPSAARLLSLLRWLPCSVADGLIARMMRRYTRRGPA
jgi:NAD(P)-dependent dehydrogenase (short-subunit alcohol dehydrogenase family)